MNAERTSNPRNAPASRKTVTVTPVGEPWAEEPVKGSENPAVEEPGEHGFDYTLFSRVSTNIPRTTHPAEATGEDTAHMPPRIAGTAWRLMASCRPEILTF